MMDSDTHLYFMEDQREANRLATKVDPVAWVTEYLQPLLPTSGLVLDIGCGPGVIARALAAVNPKIEVIGYDGSEDRIGHATTQFAELPNARAVRGVAGTLPFSDETFDVVYSRLLMQYLADKQRVVHEMVRVLKPGGTLLLQDLDGQLLWHYPEHESLQTRLTKVVSALSQTEFDPFVGRKLFSMMKFAGLNNLDVKIQPYHLFAGEIDEINRALWETKLDIALPAAIEALGSEAAARELRDDFLDYLSDADTFTYSMICTVHGSKHCKERVGAWSA